LKCTASDVAYSLTLSVIVRLRLKEGWDKPKGQLQLAGLALLLQRGISLQQSAVMRSSVIRMVASLKAMLIWCVHMILAPFPRWESMLINAVPWHFVSTCLKHVMCPDVAFSLLVPLASHCKQMATICTMPLMRWLSCRSLRKKRQTLLTRIRSRRPGVVSL
jgi:hypothetical protein